MHVNWACLHLAESQLPPAPQLRDLGVPVLPSEAQTLHFVPRRIHLRGRADAPSPWCSRLCLHIMSRTESCFSLRILS